MSDPRLVWIAVGRLAMMPPSRPGDRQLTFHRWHTRYLAGEGLSYRYDPPRGPLFDIDTPTEAPDEH